MPQAACAPVSAPMMAHAPEAEATVPGRVAPGKAPMFVKMNFVGFMPLTGVVAPPVHSCPLLDDAGAGSELESKPYTGPTVVVSEVPVTCPPLTTRVTWGNVDVGGSENVKPVMAAAPTVVGVPEQT